MKNKEKFTITISPKDYYIDEKAKKFADELIGTCDLDDETGYDENTAESVWFGIQDGYKKGFDDGYETAWDEAEDEFEERRERKDNLIDYLRKQNDIQFDRGCKFGYFLTALSIIVVIISFLCH